MEIKELMKYIEIDKNNDIDILNTPYRETIQLDIFLLKQTRRTNTKYVKCFLRFTLQFIT